MVQNQKSRVAIIEDDNLIRRHLEENIRKTDHFLLDFSVQSYEGLCALVDPELYNPDIILLDMVLNGQLDGGIQVIQWFKKKKKQLPNIIVMSGYCDEWMIKLMQQAGARACVSKAMMLETGFLNSILHKVIQHTGFVSMTEMIPPQQKPTGPQPIKKLTQCQQAIINLLKKGMTQNEIAETLDKSVSTINNTVAQIKKKYNVKTTAELIDRLLNQGL